MLQMVLARAVHIGDGGVRLGALAQQQHPLLQEGAAIIKMEEEAQGQKHHHEEAMASAMMPTNQPNGRPSRDLGDGEKSDRENEDHLPGHGKALGEYPEAAQRIGVVKPDRGAQKHEDSGEDRSPLPDRVRPGC